MFNNKIKKIIGQELHKYRCDRFLQLKTVAAKTGVDCWLDYCIAIYERR